MKPQIKINTEVPDAILAALSKVRGKYSMPESVFHCVHLWGETYVGVAGDGRNGAYEYFTFRDGKLECSEAGYGCPEVALRDVLIKELE